VFSVKGLGGFFLSLKPAVLSLVAGGLLIWKPAEGALSLTALMIVFFAAEGFIQITSSIGYRGCLRDSWEWLFLSGIADLVLAAIIIYGWPVTAAWTLGLLAGVNLITSGSAIMMTKA
jgi:uncharacterized membrane protein HdeD (DUF308 family)